MLCLKGATQGTEGDAEGLKPSLCLTLLELTVE